MNTENPIPPVENQTETKPAVSPLTGGKMVVDTSLEQGAITLHFPPSPPSVKPGELDSLDRPFDPEKFKPEKDSIGRWKNLRGGRPSSKSETAQKPDFSDIEAAARNAVSEKGETPIEAALMENATAETIIGAIQTALVLIGDDEGVLTTTEKELLRRPLLRVLQKYAVTQEALPAEFDLAVACAGLVVSRIKKPKTATFFAKVRMGLGNWWARRKGAQLASDVIEATE